MRVSQCSSPSLFVLLQNHGSEEENDVVDEFEKRSGQKFARVN